MAEETESRSDSTPPRTISVKSMFTDEDVSWDFWPPSGESFTAQLRRACAANYTKEMSGNSRTLLEVQSSTFHFLGLPREIRNMIYNHLIEEDPIVESKWCWSDAGKMVTRGQFKDLEYSHQFTCGMLCVSRAIHKEARETLLRQATIFIMFLGWNRKNLIDVLQQHSLTMVDMKRVPELYIRFAVANCCIGSPRLQLLVNLMSRMIPRMPRLKNVVLDIKATGPMLAVLLHVFPTASSEWALLNSSRDAHDMDRLFGSLKQRCRISHVWVPVRSTKTTPSPSRRGLRSYYNAVDEDFDIDLNSPALKRWCLDTLGLIPK